MVAEHTKCGEIIVGILGTSFLKELFLTSRIKAGNTSIPSMIADLSRSEITKKHTDLAKFMVS